MIAIYGIIGAVVILLFWGLILWLAAKADKPYLDAQDPQRAKQIFGDDGEHTNESVLREDAR